MDLTAKRYAIIGPQGCGKTELSKYIARQFASAVIIDPLDEYDDMPEGTHQRYIPDNLHYSDASNREMDQVVKRLVTNGPYARKVDLWMVDEATRFFPRSKPLPNTVSWLNDTIRHTGLAWGIIARRLVQLNTDLTELCHYLFIFRLTGKNDLARADDIHQGLADIILSLPEYHFVSRDPYGKITVHEPIPLTK